MCPTSRPATKCELDGQLTWTGLIGTDLLEAPFRARPDHKSDMATLRSSDCFRVAKI